MLNVSLPSVQRARKVHQQGIEKLQKAVEQGKVAVSRASNIATLPEEEQDKIVEQGPKSIRQNRTGQKEPQIEDSNGKGWKKLETLVEKDSVLIRINGDQFAISYGDTDKGVWKATTISAAVEKAHQDLISKGD